jgi:DNA end-binding protein Ku
MATELIRRNTEKFSNVRFTDGYEAALHALVEAKLKNKPLPGEEKKSKPGKVIDLMDALRQSIEKRGRGEPGNPRPRKTSSSRGRGISLVKPSARGKKKVG